MSGLSGVPVRWRGVMAAGLLLAALPAFAARDVVLVLDNSGSMRKNDPARLAVPAVSEFIHSQPRDTRVGIVLFAAQAELVLPLMPAEVAGDGDADSALGKFNYRGAWTQIAAGVERGLYELRTEGRPDSTRAIVLMTDGLIDTGNAARDAELNQWLRRDLAAQAKREGVRIYGIAFTERADFQLLQSLAANTGGEYFRVLTAEGIGRTLQRIDAALAAGGRAPAAAATEPAEPAAAEPEAALEAPTRSEPAQPVADDAYPSLAQIAGHAMASIFLDALGVDIERMQRINRTLALLPDSARQDTPLRPLESLVISPSQRIDEIATRHQALLPKPVRALLYGGAASRPGDGAQTAAARGAAMASYLLFEAPFTRALMALGEADAMDRRDEVLQFFAWDRPAARRSMPAEPWLPPALPGGAVDFVLP